MILPHKVTHKRPTSSRSAGGMEVIGATETVEEHVKCLIAPAGTNTQPTVFGVVEIDNDLIFLDPYDAAGDLRRVYVDDILIDETTDNAWRAVGPGNPMQCPYLFAGGSEKYHHIEVRVARADPETLRL